MNFADVYLLETLAGEARRTTPCVLFMPQIEQWVMHKFVNTHEVEKKVTCCPGSQESSVLHAAEGRHYSNGTAQIKVELQEGEPQMVVSNAWNVMKQQLQSMPPDTSIMLLVRTSSSSELVC
jgi:SpoVK/Ycf46/Vps4 family AAA+-type ATPase